jgi:hypothetical protein
MTDQQKQICCDLLRASFENGFGSSYPLKPIAAKLGITEQDIYDANSETGIMWEYGSYGNGFISFTNHGNGLYASVQFDTKDLLESWSGFRY